MSSIKYSPFVCLMWILLISCQAQKPASTISDVHASDSVSLVVFQYSLDDLMGKFDPSNHSDFALIPSKYRDNEIRYMRKAALEAFILMFDAAMKEGIRLQIRSATRNFENQKRIWENKWSGKTILEDRTNAATDIARPLDRAKKILEYSSMPGTSRHHWGTDIDINSFENSWFESGEGLKLYEWMQKNAEAYGFCQPYSKMGSDRNEGYFEEKWHWSYIPLSAPMTKQASEKISNEMISGFLGSETAIELDVVNRYILGISPVCTKKNQ